jgi:hypothetical protein
MGKFLIIAILTLGAFSCGSDQKPNGPISGSAFPKNQPQELTYQTVSKIIQDMKQFHSAVQKLHEPTLRSIDQNYQNVVFVIDRSPLFLNVYPDPAGGRIIFLLVPKDPATGGNYLLTYDQKLPVIDSETVELQIRTKDPEKPLTCTLDVADTAAYMTEYPSHQFHARHLLTKKFLQSGTYDFDALTVPGYRTRGYAFITFDLVKAEVVDQTANLTASCVE